MIDFLGLQEQLDILTTTVKVLEPEFGKGLIENMCNEDPELAKLLAIISEGLDIAYNEPPCKHFFVGAFMVHLLHKKRSEALERLAN